MKIAKKTIGILGTEYSIITDIHENILDDGTIGNVDLYKKIITIEHNLEEGLLKETLRHEILHAFLYESGLNTDSLKVNAWARNEEMIDWFAIQSPKMMLAYSELGIL